ncbi:MAG: alpha/beta hydrolase [Nitrospinae bacterium CG11_big_fil_rev_8_21_14_0_20_45_15]|nr:MAG: alpha/beta hydrolase [Nitrospinae bacterium CG11_big_fil_rev_8_21_14_0_20_45_15]
MVVDLSPFKELYPFDSHWHRLGELKYHYLDEGEGENLLMLHGNPSWSFYYRNLTSAFRNNYRCIVPDHIGCGLSDKPQNYNYTLSQHIDNLENLVNKLEIKDLTLIVHDWGGAIGMGFATRRPELIRRLVIFNTAAFLSPHIPLSINLCRLPLFGDLAIRYFNAFAKGAVYRACKNRKRMTGQVKAGYLAPYNSPENRIANLRFVQDIPMSASVPSYSVVQNIQSKLHLFKDHPIQIIWGKQDFCFNDHFLNKWKSYYPKANVDVMEEAGHYVVEDAHEQIVPLLKEFLSTNPLE